ncbi:MAG: hypothetical protein HYS25_11280 [Ignavibacteriales bacterium]|nr:hypothetical protein [Ignavibacteriales bacterium]
MSWIYGIIHTDRSQISLPEEIKNRALKTIHSNEISICAGGNERNIFYDNTVNDSLNGWLVVGIGLLKSNNSYKILDNSAWKNLLDCTNIAAQLEGHYIILKWNENNFEIITDRLGLRDIYFSQVSGSIIFSTRIDWLAKSVNAEINFGEFGSRWLLFNQISTNCILNNITRVTAGSIVKVNLHSLEYKIEKSNFSFAHNNSIHDISSFSEKLEEFISAPPANDFRTALSLSGGMDSRVILSCLLNDSNKKMFETHTFGSSDHPDYFVANKIANDFGIAHHNFNRPLPSAQDCIEELTNYTNETIVNGSASGILQLNNYKLLKDFKNTIIIDGGFGEIWRREFLYRLLFSGRKFLHEKNYDEVLPHMMVHRADIFDEGVKEKMLAGCKEQLANIFNELPSIEEIGVENWLDLFAIKTRLPNYYGHEQSRTDFFINSFMPFAQFSLLQILASIPIKSRKNAGLFKKIIRNNNNGLSRYQLVKGASSHPYFLNTFQARLWNFASNKLNGRYGYQNQSQIFLSHIKEFVDDVVNSKSVNECFFYDYKKISKIYDEYNSGNVKAAKELDWFLSFEIFRKSIYSN